MTLQNEVARHWFQPLVPMDAPEESPAEAGPVTTHVAGELALDDAPARPAHRRSTPLPPATPNGTHAHSATTAIPPSHTSSLPDGAEQTQPFIPAVRSKPPEFAKQAPPEDSTPTVRTPLPKSPPPPEPAPPTRPPADDPESFGVHETPQQPRPENPPPAKRSLLRRVVRAIIGPDLLRKDPSARKR